MPVLSGAPTALNCGTAGMVSVRRTVRFDVCTCSGRFGLMPSVDPPIELMCSSYHLPGMLVHIEYEPFTSCIAQCNV